MLLGTHSGREPQEDRSQRVKQAFRSSCAGSGGMSEHSGWRMARRKLRGVGLGKTGVIAPASLGLLLRVGDATSSRYYIHNAFPMKAIVTLNVELPFLPSLQDIIYIHSFISTFEISTSYSTPRPPAYRSYPARMPISTVCPPRYCPV